MAFYFASCWTEFFFTVFLLVFVYYLYYKFVIAQYWKKRNVPHEKPMFFFGNSFSTFLEPLAIWTAKMYRKYKKKKMIGVWAFSNPFLIINDIELIKRILVSDFSYFRDHGIEFDFEREPLAAHLFNLNGAKWRNLRVKLTPTFTSGKMKMMFPAIVKVGEQLRDYLSIVAANRKEIEVKDTLSNYTSDIIASCAFGIETNSLKNPDSELQKYAKKVFKPTLKNFLTAFVFNISPKLFYLLKMRFIPKDVSDYFVATVKNIMDSREKYEVKRNDFMQLLIQLKNKGKLDDVDEQVSNAVDGGDSTPLEEMKFGFLEAAAQAFVFFLAGFETSATTMTFALYELAINTDVQSKLREEIDRVLKKHKNVSYEAIMEIEYLDWVLQETLRIHPPVSSLIRTCTKEYQIPEHNVKIEKGTLVLIPAVGIHWDPEFFPNPLKFDPTRFSPEEKAKRDHFMSLHFGEGPRICIGNRFAFLQIKVGIVSILSHFEVEVSENTPIPIEYDVKSQLLAPKGGLHLKFKERQQKIVVE